MSGLKRSPLPFVRRLATERVARSVGDDEVADLTIYKRSDGSTHVKVNRGQVYALSKYWALS